MFKRLSESNAYPKSVQEVKNHILQSVREQRLTEFDTYVLKTWQKKYPGLKRMEVLTIFWLHQCLFLKPLQFNGNTTEEVKKYISQCENFEKTINIPNIQWKTKQQIGYALQAGMEQFNGTTQEEAEEYIEKYYEKLKNKELNISKEEMNHYTADREQKIKSHLQNSVCKYCHNNISPCCECPHYKIRLKQAK